MYSIVFQLAGSMLLSWLVVSRREKDIILTSWTTVNVGKKINPKIYRLYKETYLSIFGFVYLTIGYIIQFLSLDNFTRNFLYHYNPINRLLSINIFFASILNIIFLVTLGVIVAYRVSKYRYEKLSIDDVEKYVPEGSIKID